jgi:hypothetical protein
VLRETDPWATIWELLLPEVARRLPTELAAVESYVDERFLTPWRPCRHILDRHASRETAPALW